MRAAKLGKYSQLMRIRAYGRKSAIMPGPEKCLPSGTCPRGGYSSVPDEILSKMREQGIVAYALTNFLNDVGRDSTIAKRRK